MQTRFSLHMGVYLSRTGRSLFDDVEMPHRVDGNNLACSELVLLVPKSLAVEVLRRLPLPNPKFQCWVCSFGVGCGMQDCFHWAGGLACAPALWQY